MMGRRWWCLVAGILACASPEPSDPTAQVASATPPQDEKLRDTSTVLHPQTPDAGEFTYAAVGVHNLEGRLAATAAICDEVRLMELVVRTDSIDVMFLMHLPADDGVVPESFAVVSPSDSVFPPSTVRVGLQILRGRIGSIFRGVAGSVKVSDWDPRISGTFALTIREVSTEAVSKVAGAFRGIRVRAGDPTECGVNAELFVPPDSNSTREIDSVPAPTQPDGIR